MKITLFSPQGIFQLGRRRNQEDAIYPPLGEATEHSRLFIVCDGMGGHEKGEVASNVVCQSMSRVAEPLLDSFGTLTDEHIAQLLNEAYDRLDEADVFMEGKMGTTMTMLSLSRSGCLCAHIGDSRIYHLRPSEGQVRYRSRDDSLVHQLYELGEISYNAMATSPRRNIILKAMQPHQETRAMATVVRITDVRPDDYFYLCTDGMLENMEDNELMSILSSPLTDGQKAEQLKQLTANNADNHSAYLIHVKDVEHEPGDRSLPDNEKEARRTNKALNDPRKDVAWNGRTVAEQERSWWYRHVTAPIIHLWKKEKKKT